MVVAIHDVERPRAGFTILEIFVALAITLVLSAIAVPAYRGYTERAKGNRTVREIGWIEDSIKAYELETRAYPDTLAEAGVDITIDPWGNPYQYIRIAGPNPPKKVRKDKNLHPLNSDFDLYSMGPDGDSKMPLTAKASRDDIIRANDGAFIGTAEDY